MSKWTRYIGIAIGSLFFIFGTYILVSPKYDYLTREIRVIFAIFLFLYGAYRIVRYIFPDRDRDDEA
jgi:hypothetical protein